MDFNSNEALASFSFLRRFFICAYKGSSLVKVKSISYSDIGKPIAVTGDIDNIKGYPRGESRNF